MSTVTGLTPMPNAMTPSGTAVTNATMAMPSSPYVPAGLQSTGAMPSLASGHVDPGKPVYMNNTAPVSDLSGYYTMPHDKLQNWISPAFINKDRGVLKYHKLSDAYGRLQQTESFHMRRFG